MCVCTIIMISRNSRRSNRVSKNFCLCFQHLSNHPLLLPSHQDNSDTEVEESNRCPMCSFVASDGRIIGDLNTTTTLHMITIAISKLELDAKKISLNRRLTFH